MIKLKRKKNPSPELYKQLNKLLGEILIVRYKTNCLYFQIEGKLSKSVFHNTYEIWDQTDRKKLNLIRFNKNDISNIINNQTIELNITKDSDLDNFDYEYSLKELDDKLKELSKEKIVEIGLNYPFDDGAAGNSKISGKLKYNKSDELYYIQNKDFKSQISFGVECVKNVSYVASYINVDVNG